MTKLRLFALSLTSSLVGCQLLSGLSEIGTSDSQGATADASAGAGGTGAAAGNAGNDAAASHGGAAGQGGDPGQGGAQSGGSSGAGGSSGVCEDESASGETLPLGLYWMIDQSQSMSSTMGAQPAKTKWVALRDGLDAYLDAVAPASQTAMGLQFHPLPILPWNTVPTCTMPGGTCASGLACIDFSPLGAFCLKQCASSSECGAGECWTGTGNVCSNDTCDPTAYAQPEVPMDELPNNAAALKSALAAHQPTALSPSLVALQGALSHAKSHATQYPDRATAVVFVTDGRPTECFGGSTEMQALNTMKAAAASALADPPSVKTLVVGICASGDFVCGSDANALAVAGGTKQAVFVTNAVGWSQSLATAIDSLRGTPVSCTLPLSPTGSPDYASAFVGVSFDGAPEQSVARVQDLAACDPTAGGWYYDKEPSAGPTAIVLCPATCNSVQQVGKVTVSWKIGCAG